jgi:hypothetical protein
MIRALIGLLVIGGCGLVQAAPLVYFTLEGRPYGYSGPFSRNLAVELGDTIEYRLLMSMAAVGAQNINLHGRGFSPAYKHGINSLSISMFQEPTDLIQVDFNSLADLRGDSSPSAEDGWSHGVSARAGTLSPRNSSGWSDLVDVRPIHRPGVFTGEDDQTIYAGTFQITELTGEIGYVRPEWGPVSGAGSYFHNGFWITRNGGARLDGSPIPGTEVGPDPVAHFTPLTLMAGDLAAIPEPSTIALLGVALAGLVWVRRKQR